MSDSQVKNISTTALAKNYNITAKEMFLRLVNLGLIEKKGDVWSLTNEGINQGGKFVSSKRFGKYITWPDNIELDVTQNEKLVTSTVIGKNMLFLRTRSILSFQSSAGCTRG